MYRNKITGTEAGEGAPSPVLSGRGCMKRPAKWFAAALGAVLLACSLFLSACGGHTHELTALAAKAATCTEAGNSACWHCEACGKYFSDEEGTAEIALEDTALAALGHDLQKTAVGEGYALAGGGEEYYACSRCGAAFADEAGTVPAKLLVKMFTDQEFFAKGTQNGPDVFKSTHIGGNVAPVSSQEFVLRFFMGFTYDVSTLSSGQSVEVHMNIHRTPADPSYWQFIMEYHPTAGKETIVVTPNKNASQEKLLTGDWAGLMQEQNGLYFLLQRRGDRLACYAEDAEGQPQLLFSVTGFSEGAVYQMRIAHFEGFFADDTHGCTIRDMEIALGTVDLTAERTQYAEAAA